MFEAFPDFTTDEIFVHNFPTRIVFGAGALERLGDELKRLGLSKVLLVTDEGLVAAGVAGKVADALSEAGIEHSLFDGVHPNVLEDDVDQGAKAFAGAGAEGLVALGGGSSIDAAKCISVRVNHHRPMADYDDAKGGDALMTEPLPPIVALPTTAGTGSEVGRSAVVTLAANGRKTVIFHPDLLPRVALCDPLLTLGLPRFLTAATGMDALSHNIEAYLAKGMHPMCDALALMGIRLVVRYLKRAVDDGGNDVEARAGMMAAAYMGATAFQKGLGVCHSMAHPLGSEAGLHHGLANSVCLPHVLRFNAAVVPKRVADVARAMNVAAEGEVELIDAAVESTAFLARECGLATTLRELDVDPELLDRLVEVGIEDGCHQLNPRPVTRDDLRRLFLAAYG